MVRPRNRTLSLARAAALCALAAIPVGAYEFPAPGGAPLRWAPSPHPIPYYIDRRAVEGFADGADVEAIQAAFRTWEGIATADIRFRFAGLVRDGAEVAGESVVVWMKDDWPYESRYVAKTRLYYRPDEGAIVRAEIDLNGRDYRWSADGSAGTLDVRNAATHEVGHFLGLGDVRAAGQTMFEYIALDEREKGELSDDEIEGLRAAYPRIAADDGLAVSALSLDYGDGALRPSGDGPALPGGETFAALVPLPGSSFGILRAAGGMISLLLPAERDGGWREIPVAAGAFNPGRIRAVSALPPSAPGERARLAAFVSTADGMAFALGPVPAGDGGAVTVSLMPAEGADDIVAFAPLGSDESGFEGALAVIEKKRGSVFHLSLARLLSDGEPDGGIILSRIRSWVIPDCTGAAGLAVIGGGAAPREIVAAVRAMSGDLELVSYSSPFAYLPEDGSSLVPSSRVDAAVLNGPADPLGIAGLPSEGSGRRRLVALTVR